MNNTTENTLNPPVVDEKTAARYIGMSPSFLHLSRMGEIQDLDSCIEEHHCTAKGAIMSNKNSRLIKVDEVAGMLGVTPRTVYRLADSGKLPRPLKIGFSVRWRRAELENWIEAGCPIVRPVKKAGVR